MTFPFFFPPKRELNVNFDFTDFLQNQGFVTFYLGSAYNDTATDTRILSRNLFESITKTVSNSLANLGAEQKIGDEDYDIEVGTTQTIEGQANCEFLWKHTMTQGNGGVIGGLNTIGSGFIIVRIRKWDGSTETEIGSGKTNKDTRSTQSSSSATSRTNLIINCTSTRLNKGDFIRITVESWAETTAIRFANDSNNIQYKTDPLRRLKTAVNYNKPGAEEELFQYSKDTDFKVAIPFAIVT